MQLEFGESAASKQERSRKIRSSDTERTKKKKTRGSDMQKIKLEN